MKQVSVGEAKNKLPLFLHLAESGEEIQITRHGKMVAYINGANQKNQFDKKEMFLDSISFWRKKNADWLLSDSDADSIFARDSNLEDDVRHKEDFGL
ncbi:MAG: type II toxin-antitoxin system Phd/YefM family antitoxin [Treponema sp.]|nr:type II toxin-antitoxin system Phd/YefM family antitoxin [Treponema sp.]